MRIAFIVCAALIGGSAAMAEDAKMPALDSKEWKPVKGQEGLQFWDAVEGKGEACTAGAVVKIHYTGWTTDGNLFDTSKKTATSAPATFPLKKLIKGWQDGFPGMKPGGTRRLYIPWTMAYGAEGSPPDIPAKADLVFEIELISVAK